VRLHGGKVLHLGPGKNGQIADQDLERPAVEKMIKAGEIEVLGTDRHPDEIGGGGSSPESTHGHRPPTSMGRKGDR
jgi:hypothetical protein